MKAIIVVLLLFVTSLAGAFGFDTAFWSKRGVDAAFSSVVLLVHGDGTDGSTTLTDQKGNTVITAGNAHVDTSQSVAGGASVAFDGSGDYFYVNNPAALSLGAGDFTIEFWIKFNNVSAIQTIIDGRPAYTATAYPCPNVFITADGKIHYMTLNADQIVSTNPVTTGVWYHMAISRVSGSTRLFIDGTQTGGTYADSLTYDAAANRPFFGIVADGVQYGFNGWMDDIRITKGVGRYSANFTRPTPPFADR